MLPITSISQEMTNDSPRACVHNTVRDLFISGKNYKETSQYKRMVDTLNKGSYLYKCKSIKEIDRYFEKLNQAYVSIKKYGYKSQPELGNSPRDEIRIHITEDGSICLGSKGNHRLRIAQILDIRHIPCNIYGVNIKWMISLAKKSELPPHQALLQWMKA
ncbi:MAG: hypothetical protein OSA84_11405 [Akkermansiaceae bacterium]|nr:hypothetical protein [Akkermansiaceae bacterium]